MRRMSRTTRLVGKLSPSPDSLTAEQRDRVVVLLRSFNLDGCVTDAYPNGELLFDFRGKRHSYFTAGNWGFASILSNFFAVMKREGLEYSGSFKLETKMDLTGDFPTVQELEVVDSVLFHLNPENGERTVVTPSAKEYFVLEPLNF